MTGYSSVGHRPRGRPDLLKDRPEVVESFVIPGPLLEVGREEVVVGWGDVGRDTVVVWTTPEGT